MSTRRRRRIKDKSETGKRLVGYEAVSLVLMFFRGHFSWSTVAGRRKSPSMAAIKYLQMADFFPPHR
jgi:hypothetical protein